MSWFSRWVLVSLIAALPVGAQTPASSNTADTAALQRLLESYEKLQGKQEATARAVEEVRAETVKVRQDASNQVQRVAERALQQVNTRVQEVEQTLAAQHTRELSALNESHRSTLTAVGAVAGIAALALVGMALLFWRTMARRHEAVPINVTPPMPAIGLPSVEPATGRLLGAVDQLEKRLQELEASTQPVPLSRPALEAPNRASLLLGKGQAHLNLQQHAEALACFEEAAKLEPGNAEAFVRCGTALEKLDRLDEAIAAYDKAIALNDGLLMAYLRKGGLYNRLERPADALACYERALRTNEKPRPA